MDANTISSISQAFHSWITQENEEKIHITTIGQGEESTSSANHQVSQESSDFFAVFFVLNFLEAVTRINRFSLNINFLNAKQKQVLTNLFAILQSGLSFQTYMVCSQNIEVVMNV